MGDELAMTSEAKIENLLFVVWVQDQRFDYWKKVIRETKEKLEELKLEMECNERLFHG
jgi:hypothetical protein